MPNRDDPSAATTIARVPPNQELRTPRQILEAIVAEVDRMQAKGMWLNRASPLLAEARVALRVEAGPKRSTLEASLRDLIGRVEYVRKLIAENNLDPNAKAALELLDTTDCRKALQRAPEGDDETT